MITLDQVSKTYRNGKVKALDNVDLHVKEGEFMLVRGPSGSGKTTLLLTIGGVLRPTAGEVIVAGNNLYAMSERERAKFRAENIGFVFQMFHLLPYLSATANVLLAAGARRQRAGRDEAMRLLNRLGLVNRECHKPSGVTIIWTDCPQCMNYLNIG